MKKNIVLECYDGRSGYVRGRDNDTSLSVQEIDGGKYVLARDGIYRITLDNAKAHTAIATKISKEKEDYILEKESISPDDGIDPLYMELKDNPNKMGRHLYRTIVKIHKSPVRHRSKTPKEFMENVATFLSPGSKSFHDMIKSVEGDIGREAEYLRDVYKGVIDESREAGDNETADFVTKMLADWKSSEES